jgi:solute carrier family 35 protein E1
MVAPLSFCWTLGFVLFNASASKMSPSHVNLVRCAEPFATVAVGFLFLSKRYSPQLLMTLIPICGGVALASWNGNNGNGKTSSLSIPGIVLACLSNVSFCVRPFCLQRLKQQQQQQQQQQPFDDDVLIFFYVTLMASVGLPLFVITIEGAAIGVAIRRFATDGLLFNQFLTNAFLSSIFFFLYQFTQLQVMSTMSPLAFSILTPFVKAIMIVVCSLYFGDSLGMFSFLGILSTTGGGYLFSRVLIRSRSSTTTNRITATTTTTKTNQQQASWTTTTKDKNLPLYHNGGTTTRFKRVCKPHQV